MVFVKLIKIIGRFLIKPFKGKYKLIACLGLIIRTILLPIFVPDFFELLFGTLISTFGLPNWLYEIIIRLILAAVDFIGLSQIIYRISFLSVGVSYGRGTNPTWGSICYTVYYCLYSIIAAVLVQNLFVPLIIPGVATNRFAIILIIMAYWLWLSIALLISNRLNTFPHYWPAKASLLFLIYLIILFVITVAIIGPPWQ